MYEIKKDDFLPFYSLKSENLFVYYLHNVYLYNTFVHRYARNIENKDKN